ncbi:YdcF family protein [Piscirickettsia litoralis]|uniref:DUF218 domain-containing protein n=1 Tax=Piscirickettsia litoralis TaxID=1891921 RepID=A0ABX3AAJ9_9GAMM|nr:ElyC/SanA/YdcF family protein [Piscirickettsia litoralis]ODN43154.1 hypothetical protein BGC07_09810 [Piscirickettsia litoralis]
MPFYFMKFMSSLLYPLPLFFILLALAALSLFYSRIASLTLLIFSISWLALWSTPFLPQYLLNKLESQHSPLTKLPDDINTIVILGGGAHTASTPSPFTELSRASVARIVSAVRLYQQARRPITLVVSGGSVLGSPIEAELLEQAAITLGIPKEHIITDDVSKNTAAQAIMIKKLLKNNRFALVTSASHLPRALWLFDQQGLSPIAAPSDFIAQIHPRFYYLPQAAYLQRSRIVIHEYLGLFWAYLHQF